jgi:hypothetical protein
MLILFLSSFSSLGELQVCNGLERKWASWWKGKGAPQRPLSPEKQASAEAVLAFCGLKARTRLSLKA